jgi:hypothetical protein
MCTTQLQTDHESLDSSSGFVFFDHRITVGDRLTIDVLSIQICTTSRQTEPHSCWSLAAAIPVAATLSILHATLNSCLMGNSYRIPVSWGTQKR